MITKTIAWKTGSGAITLTYTTGQGNDSISVASNENDSFDERSQSFDIVTTAGSPEKAVSILVKQQGKKYAVGEVFNFGYTGSVQEITLPKGKYKLQCWGAQGGNVTGTYAVNGSKGGYSEGVLTLTETTKLYVFIGGQGTAYTSSASQTSTSVVNGGWNGGGAGRRTSKYNSGDTDGRSFPRGGGGATDISTVTSALSYSSGRTTRDSASLLARCIVAGGGAGASARYTSITNSTTKWTTVANVAATSTGNNASGTKYALTYVQSYMTIGETYRIIFNTTSTDLTGFVVWHGGTRFWADFSSPFTTTSDSFVYTSDISSVQVVISAYTDVQNPSFTIQKQESTTSTSTSSGKSSAAQQGGGTSGKGQYPGTQTSAGSGGAFGLGASQTATTDRYCSGGGGGGWYGGGRASSDSSTSYINYSGGGSGFVNTAANTSPRPNGYTGLQLDSGTTKDGSTSFESTSGGTETGHSGNGFARITVLGDKEPIPSEYTELAYIESTGSQYIDTGFKPNNNTRVVLSAYNLSNSSGWTFGTWESATSKQFAFSCNGTYSFRYGTTSKSLSQVPIGEFYVDYNKNNYIINDVFGSFTAQTFESEHNMYLFAINANGAVSSGKYTGRIYFCKIYDNGILVRDYVPAKDSNGVIGLYDKLNNVFYSSASNTDFTGA